MTPNSVQARKYNVDMQVADQNDCLWKISGWIDASLIPPKINHYDVWAEDCHGNKYHFEARIATGDFGGDSLEDYDYSFVPIACPGECSDEGKYFLFDELVEYIQTLPAE